MIAVLATLPAPILGPAELVRVDDPDHPNAIARSETGALLAEPPSDGTPWRLASIPEIDETSGLEAVRATNVELWHEVGAAGQDVKVAVFDIGWFIGDGDPAPVGEVSTHDCFRSQSCDAPLDPYQANTTGEGGIHGWACAEAIRQVAPEVELYLVRVNSFTALENAAAWAIREGIDIISMSMSYYNASFYDGTGPHDAISRALDAAGVLMVTSAGNIAGQHWSGAFLDGDADGRMDGDGSNGLELELRRDTTINVVWNQFGRCGDTDLDAYLLTEDGRVIGASEVAQVDSDDDEECQPVERVRARVPNEGFYHLEVRHRRGVRTDLNVSVITRGGGFTFARPQGSLTDPAAHPRVVAVGAVPVDNYFLGGAAPFSSWGPSHAGAVKPDIAGPHGYTVSGYGPGGFRGTSAATPVVAGMIAVVMSDEPDLTSREAFERLQGWARQGENPLNDPSLGGGKARLPLPEPSTSACGRRPLAAWVFVFPLWLCVPLRRRRHG